ncbi:MAG TPA: RtcB family protein [Gaiellaceae bacterium]|jgi:tRNA-splicing ligase RtcB|nr:RtcB family protein [Gaiellaceae bacterium]
MSEPVRVAEAVWEIPAGARPDMRVPARIFADEELLTAILSDRSLEQLCNVATLPGIVEAALAMPDVHQGYGFPVGAVAATETPDGVISPGGVGYDINCGVRLLALPLRADELGGRREQLVHAISRTVPAGAGRRGGLRPRAAAFERVLTRGPRVLVEELGIGTAEDVERTESEGCLPGADAAALSARALERGSGQLGTIGSGNHFVELQRVDSVLDPAAAAAYGLAEGQATVLLHSGSRGLGHQVCTDHVRTMEKAERRYGIELPDRQLACAPLSSPEGQAYLAAMAAAANFAFANRHVMTHLIREAIRRILGDAAADGTRQVYDVAHNIAKLERHDGRELCVQRKGATRAFSAGSDELPAPYRTVGQPVFIPGSMGTASFVLAGEPGAMEHSFGTVCHGAGRRLSRTAAKKQVTGVQLRRELAAQGVVVRCPTNSGLAEEAPFAYKDVERVVAVVERAGLARRVARLRPIGVVKG